MFLSPKKPSRKFNQSPNRIEAYLTQSIPAQTRRIFQSSFVSENSIQKKEISIIPSDQQILNINCMNCQELIPIEKIEDHSKVCTTTPENVKNIESGEYLSQIMFKLQKLENCLNDMSRNPELRPGDKNYIAIFSRLCQKVIKNNSIEDVDSVMQSLSSLLVTFKGSLSIRVYADRLQALAQEQKLGFQELEIENKKQELEKIKEQVEKYKTRTQVLQKTLLKTTPPNKIGELNRKLDEITSDIGSLYSSASELTANSAIEEEKQDFEENLTGNSTDLRKHFYSLCLSLKMKSSGKASVQNVSIQKLYKEAIETNVPPDVWPQFITNQLKNPLKWAEETRPRRFQPKNSSMKSQYFEVIVEEDNS